MSAPLNRQPTGLLDFFGIKNGGQYPRELSQLLQGTFDLVGLYEAGGQIVTGGITGAVSAGTVLFGPAGATTTPGDTWHVHAMNMFIDASAAGDGVTVSLGVVYGTGTFVGLSDMFFAAVATVPARNGAVVRDLWLPPGASLAYRCHSLAGAPTFELSWAAIRYRY